MAFAQQHKDGVLLAIRLQPRASRNAIGQVVGDELKIAVTAPPVDSAANEALRRFLADCLHCSKSAVQLIRGQTSRHKQVLVTGLALEVVQQRLTATGKAAH
jgi:uncharacterized protein (TIGR00251 family)